MRRRQRALYQASVTSLPFPRLPMAQPTTTTMGMATNRMPADKAGDTAGTHNDYPYRLPGQPAPSEVNGHCAEIAHLRDFGRGGDDQVEEMTIARANTVWPTQGLSTCWAFPTPRLLSAKAYI